MNPLGVMCQLVKVNSTMISSKLILVNAAESVRNDYIVFHDLFPLNGEIFTKIKRLLIKLW